MAVRILIADDHQIVRQGLRQLLMSAPGFEVVGEAANGAEAVRLAGLLEPDVVLMDLLMPGEDGVTAIAAIHREIPETKVLALTSLVEERGLIDAVRAGAIGYLLKVTDANELRRAIKGAAAGEMQLSPKASALLLREMRPPRRSALTDRETMVLGQLAAGKANKAIARELKIRETTVKWHVGHILDKLGAESRTQAVLCAFQRGLIAEPRRGGRLARTYSVR
jgi:DNA-binding NarL/FixJ family response regulator